jgi:imidazolonepropionase-like amidohydrolase
VEDGKISKIGTNVLAPEGVEEYDAQGAFVTPGLVGIHKNISQKKKKKTKNKPIKLKKENT